MAEEKNSNKSEYGKAPAVAAKLGLSERYIRQLTIDGRLPVHRIGPRCHLYRWKDVEAFMASNRIGGQHDV